MFILNIFLTALLVLVCLVLILLVLVQLPKKEAGMGQAFGGCATDALFGAGSGNALTKITKYTTAIFFVLTLVLSIWKIQENKNQSAGFQKAFQNAAKQPENPAAATTPPPSANTSSTSKPVLAPLVLTATNATSKPATNTPATPLPETPK